MEKPPDRHCKMPFSPLISRAAPSWQANCIAQLTVQSTAVPDPGPVQRVWKAPAPLCRLLSDDGKLHVDMQTEPVGQHGASLDNKAGPIN